MNSQPDFREILARLDALERQNRMWRAVVVAVLAVSCVGFMAAARVADKGIDVERISLRDPTGRERLRLEVDAKGDAVQSFFDSDGTDRIRFCLDKDDIATLAFQPKNDDPRAMLYLSKEGDAGFLMRDGVKTRFETVVGSNGVAAQKFRDRQGIVRINTETDLDGDAAQSFSDKAGQGRLNILTRGTGDAMMVMFDQAGKNRFLWGTTKDGAASQSMSDREGKLRFVSMTLPNGNAAQHAIDQAGVPRIEQWTTLEGFAYHQVNDKKHVTRFLSGTGPNGEATQGVFDDEGKPRITFATRSDGSAYQSINGKQPGDPYSLLLTSPQRGIIHQFSIGEGNLKVGTTVTADGSASQYIEKSTVDKIIEWARFGRELYGLGKDAKGAYDLMAKPRDK